MRGPPRYRQQLYVVLGIAIRDDGVLCSFVIALSSLDRLAL